MNSSGYGAPPTSSMSGGIPSQRLPTQQQTYEAPACVQNAMMTKDKKPFTYTPGGIDLSQIKSERMAKRLARNAQAEGATGASQLNRPTQPLSPGGCSPAAASMGAAAMGMPFQVFPTGPPAAPPPPPSTGKQHQNSSGSIGAPPPPPPPSTTTTLAPANNTNNGSTLAAPNSPNAARKSPTPQRFEPPPMGFRPEIKIPVNPMAILKKVAPPVEKNTFWKDEYRKERSKSPMVGENDSNIQSNSYGSHENSNNNDDNKKSFTPTMTASQQPATNNYNNNNTNNNYQQYSPQAQPSYSPPAPQQQQSPRPEFRSVAAPLSPTVNVYTQNQTDSSPQQQQQRATESPFKFAQQQSRPMQPISPLAQQHPHQQQQQQQSPSPAYATPSQGQGAQQPTAQSSAIPWRTQRSPQPPQAYQQQQPQHHPQQQQQQQQHPQPIYNNVRSRDVFSPAPDTTATYQGPKPTNVGSLYIAPLAPPVEPQAQNIVRQHLQQQAAAQRDSPMRQMPQQQQQQRQPPTSRWMSSQPVQKEQPAWARPEENGNVMPSSLQRMKSPEPMQQQQQQQHQPQQQRYQQQQGNGYAATPSAQNFGTQVSAPTGLRLQINIGSSNQSGAKERIIPIQLEQTPTPTHTPSQPGFGMQGGGNAAPSSYVMRSPNQFVDQGYNNYPAAPQQQMNAPHVVQQQQQQQQQQANYNNNTNNVGGVKTRIIPIALEGDGERGPISQAPIVIQNDQRTTPVQSKSFRILQKITDTIDGDDNKVITSAPSSAPIESFTNAEPQLQRPQFARQMSAQQARNSPTIEQMRRMQIAQEQLPSLNQGNAAAMKQAQPNKYVQQSIYNNEDKSQQYVHPSEQHVPEPKKYTGSAIPSRSFKKLQAMTTPENAAEMEDSDSIVVELNDKHNPTDNNSNQNQATTSNINANCKNCSSTTSTPNPTPPPTSSSTSSLNSEHSFSAHSQNPYHQYPPPYAYAWCQPMPNGGEQLPPNWNYPFPIPPPPPPPQTNGETTPNWHYPYPLPPPMPPKHPGDNSAYPHYPPYPYFYPFYPPPHMAHLPPTQTSTSASSIEHDSQSAVDPRSYPYHPSYPYSPYPYPIITTNSQSSNPSSSASSVLPDIIVTPSNDDGPSEIMYQHKIKVEKRDTPKRTDSVEITELFTQQSNSREPMRREQREGSVIDKLTKCLNEIESPNDQALIMEVTESGQKTVAEFKKEFDKKSSPNDTNLPKAVPDTSEDDEETSSNYSAEDSSESSESLDDETTKDEARQHLGLKVIKSVTNVQVYNSRECEQERIEDDDDDDVTSADGESDIFDEDDEECEVSSMGAELELDECIEENDIDDILEQDYLSVIYEEESEMEKSGDTRTAYRNEISSNSSEATTIDNKNLEREIEENDDDDDDDDDENNNANEEPAEDSNSVTVRLPLKFSFSRSSNDENIATVEVGNSQIEERRNSINIDEKRSTFSVAKLNLEDEEEIGDEYANEYEDDCDVSVTISLTPSSRSASLDKNSEPRFIYNMEQLKEPSKKTTEVDCTADKSSSEDVSVSFSLNMRNKFLDQTISGGMTNNIAKVSNKVEETPKTKGVPMVKAEPAEDLDFFAMLRATKMQAQQMKEHSASYWGKSEDKTADIGEEKILEGNSEKTTNNFAKNPINLDITSKTEEENNEIEDIWASRDEDSLLPRAAKKLNTLETARNSFWSTVQETANERCEVEPHEQVEPLEEDFWAIIEKSKAEVHTQFVKENLQVVQYWTTTLKSKEETMARPQKAEITIKAEEEIPPTVEKKPKTSKKKADKALKTSTRKKKKSDKVEQVEEKSKLEDHKIVETKIQEVKVNSGSSSVAQDDSWSKLTSKTEEKNMHIKVIQETEVIQEDFCSAFIKKTAKSKRQVEEIQETVAVKEELWSTLTPKTAAQETEVVKVCKSSVAQENFSTTVKTTSESTQTVKLATKDEIKGNFWEETAAVTKTTAVIETEEAEIDFWADIEASKSSARVCESLYDSTKYPEEPREVDTDEEIDFWAEIEAKNNPNNDDDITFHKAANFWASRDRQNSVDETPYKPLTKTPFHARLPDEPSVDMNAWAATLEAAKGEEPEIIDPAVEDEKMLVLEFNNLPTATQEVAEKNYYDTVNNGFVAVEEFVADVCTEVQTEDRAKEVEPDFWATTNNDKEIGNVTLDTDEREELEMKRNNYRKAMAFFTSSVDEQKEQKSARGGGERKSITRNKAVDESDTPDWQAVETAVQQDMEISNNSIIKAAEPSFDITSKDNVQEEEEEEEQKSDRNSTPTNFETKLTTTYKENAAEACQEEFTTKSPPSSLLDLQPNKASEEQKPSVRDRIHAFETGIVETSQNKKLDIKMQSLSVESYSSKSPISRNSSSQRSESELEEEDSGVTDMNKHLSETDTESESFPELRKMTSYQRAATHSRLFKLLQDENDEEAEKPSQCHEEKLQTDEFQLKPSRRKIVHNVSITRRQNPKAIQSAESMSERRERLSLPLRKKNSIDADNPSTPNSPASPIVGQPNNRVVSDKLVNELVQSLLLKRDSSHLRTLPMEKLQAAAKRVLEEEMDSLENTSVETTPAPTPNSAKADRSYADYYDSWSDATGTADIVPSKAFRALQDRPKRSPWSVKCPRVLSSKTINRDLTRVTESPEIVSRSSKSPERFVRESSVSKWKKI